MSWGWLRGGTLSVCCLCFCWITFVINEIVCIHDQLSSRGSWKKRDMSFRPLVCPRSPTAGQLRFKCVSVVVISSCVLWPCGPSVSFHCELMMVEAEGFLESERIYAYESSPPVQNNTQTHTHGAGDTACVITLLNYVTWGTSCPQAYYLIQEEYRHSENIKPTLLHFTSL